MISSVVAAAMGLGSCTGDLDLLPTDPTNLTADKFAADPEGYMDAVLADCYLNFVTEGVSDNTTVTKFNGGMAVFQRALFILEEIPTDEANWLSASDTEYGTLQYAIPTTTNVASGGCYSRLIINITLCNDFIRTVNQGLFQLSTPEQFAKAEEYVRQAKILRSVCYYYMIDLFGNVPYADENTEIGSVPAQLKRADLYNLVTKTLEDVSAEYNGRNDAKYGFVGLDVADAYLVKFYLNSEVYTGTPAWDKCYRKANEIIARHKGNGFKGSGLAPDYHNNFAFNNKQYSLGGGGNVSEILWALPVSDPELMTYGGATILTNAYLGSPKNGLNGVAAVCDQSLVNCYNGWGCMTARREFTEVFDWNSDYTESPDKRVRFWYTAKSGFNIDNAVLNTDDFGNNGYLPIKYSNWAINADGSINVAESPAVAPDRSPTPYAMVRLAEIYLSAAEAALEGGGSREDALTYVNYIRERAGLSPWTATDLSLPALQQERQRELYTEGTRRTDLIRYGKWISGYNWAWKNNVRMGADLPAHYNLYPLPDVIVSLAGYEQNPGY